MREQFSRYSNGIGLEGRGSISGSENFPLLYNVQTDLEAT
jgi:hypothetical protein